MTPQTKHPAVANTDFSWRDVWPRRPDGDVALPPGQRLVRAFPRFADNSLTPPPSTDGQIAVRVLGAVARPTTIDADALATLARIDRTADFHCVTTWSLVGLRWSGWSLAELWHQIIVPTAEPDPKARWIVATGADGFRARLHLDDALAADPGDQVLIVDTLEGEPLDTTHGAPLRLVSPRQYGYKSIKHLDGIEVHVDEPPSAIGPKEHPRARVAREERHARYPAQLLRWPYRLVVPATAVVTRWSARR
ncbi:MAG: molybdopterin-dependent oxidoreductase [Acidimicrobiia bacterium]|nr:molybdopterin-dependent oxidoreductase [Acidimicrobiia bacterium]